MFFRQEGVDIGFYKPLEVEVTTPEGTMKRCRTYQQINVTSFTENIENLIRERQPSTVYLEVIKEGAKESNLPESYQRILSKIPHNGYNGTTEIKI